MNLEKLDHIYYSTSLMQNLDIELAEFEKVVASTQADSHSFVEANQDWLTKVATEIKDLNQHLLGSENELGEIKRIFPEVYTLSKDDLFGRMKFLQSKLIDFQTFLKEEENLNSLNNLIDNLLDSIYKYEDLNEEYDISLKSVKIVTQEQLHEEALARIALINEQKLRSKTLAEKVKFDPNEAMAIQRDEGEIVHEFPEISSENILLSNSFKKILKKLIPKLIRNLEIRIKQEYYEGWKLKNKQNKARKDVSKLKNKIDKLENKITILEKKLEDPTENHLYTMEALTDLQKEIVVQRKLLKKASKIVKRADAMEAKGIVTRNAFANIGAKPMKFVSPDGVKIDGVHVSANDFKTKMEEAGGTIVTIPDTLGDGTKEIQGFCFKYDDFENNEDHIIRNLDKLSAFSQLDPEDGDYVPGAGLCKVYAPPSLNDKEARIFLIPDKHMSSLLNRNMIQATKTESATDLLLLPSREDEREIPSLPSKEGVIKGFIFNPEYYEVLQHSKINTENKQPNGTVILSPGAFKIYEAEKENVMTFLLEYGVDVVTYNYRGYGQSEGVPSKKGLYEDLEVIYNYVNKECGVSDEEIVLYGYCLGGAPSSHIVKKHPNTNLILYNSLADIQDYAVEQLNESIDDILEKETDLSPTLKEKIKKWLLKHHRSLIVNAAKHIMPGYHTANNLKNMEGHLAFMRGVDDEVVTENDVEKYKEIAEKRKLNPNKADFDLNIYTIDGDHYDNWYDAGRVGGDEFPTEWDEYFDIRHEGRNMIRDFLFNKCQVGGSIFE